MTPREIDDLVATRVMGCQCIHRVVVLPNEIRREKFRKDFIDSYHQEPPAEYLDDQVSEDQGDYPDRWCEKCHERDISLLHRWSERNFPHYSTSIADAWEVVEKITGFVSEREKPWWSVAVFNVQPGQHSAMIYQSQPGMSIHNTHDEIAYVVADTVPMAICLAALKAVGMEIPA